MKPTHVFDVQRIVPPHATPTMIQHLRDECRRELWASVSQWLIEGTPLLMQMLWSERDVERPGVTGKPLTERVMQARLYLCPMPDLPLVNMDRARALFPNTYSDGPAL